MKTPRNLIIAAASTAACLGISQAATLVANFEPGKPLEIMNTDNDPDNAADISVFAGSAGYQGVGGDPNSNQPNPSPGTDAPVSGTFGSGTVVDYRFFGNVIDENVSLELVTRAQGAAGRIGTFVATDAANVSGGDINFLRIWTTTDPAGFTSTPDLSVNTMARVADGAGTIDINNMTSGDIWFFAGGFGGTERFTLTMSGAGQPDILVVGDAGWPRDNRVHMHDWSFTNPDLLYDTIDYTFFHGDRDGSAARFGGLILDGEIASAAIPEPSSMALLGLGAIALLRRRR